MDITEKLRKLNSINKNTLMETLDIEYVEIGNDYLVATMPVTSKVHQPAGLLHGGATVALAESLGSAASHLFIDTDKYEIRGIEITANHLRSVKDGIVKATARCIHKGRTTQLWEVKIVSDKEQLVSICKLTTIALEK